MFDCIKLAHFFLSNRTVATAIAIIIAIPVTAKYIIKSVLEITGCVAEVGATVDDAADATVAYVVAED